MRQGRPSQWRTDRSPPPRPVPGQEGRARSGVGELRGRGDSWGSAPGGRVLTHDQTSQRGSVTAWPAGLTHRFSSLLVGILLLLGHMLSEGQVGNRKKYESFKLKQLSVLRKASMGASMKLSDVFSEWSRCMRYISLTFSATACQWLNKALLSGVRALSLPALDLEHLLLFRPDTRGTGSPWQSSISSATHFRVHSLFFWLVVCTLSFGAHEGDVRPTWLTYFFSLLSFLISIHILWFYNCI